MKKSQKIRLSLLLSIITIIVIILLLPVLHELRPYPLSQEIEIQLSSERIKLMSPEEIVKLMNLEPGSIVLDLGAGRGLFTFPLAAAVGNEGKVYATDIDSKVIDFLEKKSEQKKIKNVIPILVQPNGVDEFYKTHTFDAILASEVVNLIPNVEVLFRQLALSLQKEKSRLWIINLRLDPDFEVSEFGDFKVIRETLKSKEVAQPIASRLSINVKEALAKEEGSYIPESLQNLFVKDLNRILEDFTLYPEFESKFELGKNSIFDPKEKQLREYLATLYREGVFDSKNAKISNSALSNLRLLNRLIIQDIFQTKVWENAFGLDQLWWEQWEGLIKGNKQTSVLLKIPEYELVTKHVVLTYHDVWELKRRFNRHN